MAGVNLSKVNKIYKGDVHAVVDFDLEIKDKEFVIFVGPSGCGKSTTLRMIAGLEEITSGQIKIGDRVVNDLDPKDRDIAMVFQNYALYPHMTVYENMAFGLKLRKESKSQIKIKVHEAAAILGIEELLDRKPRALSGGQRQRVALGRAIVRQPNVFLMDEPLSNLDAKLRVQMRTEISKLHQKLETTFIYVTHDQTEAMTMGDRIIIMEKGVIQQADTPQNVYKHPVNMFVAAFIGAPQMNFFEIEPKEGKEGIFLEPDQAEIPLLPAQWSALKEQNLHQSKLFLGIRPEHLQLDQKILESRKLPIFSAVTEVIETMGPESFIYLRRKNQQLIARINGITDLEPDEQVNVGIDMDQIHLFDRETQRNIL